MLKREISDRLFGLEHSLTRNPRLSELIQDELKNIQKFSEHVTILASISTLRPKFKFDLIFASF